MCGLCSFKSQGQEKQGKTVKLPDWRKQNQHDMHFLGWVPRTERKIRHFCEHYRTLNGVYLLDGDVSRLMFWLQGFYEDKKECLCFGDVYIREAIMLHIYGLLSCFFQKRLTLPQLLLLLVIEIGEGKRDREKEEMKWNVYSRGVLIKLVREFWAVFFNFL